LADETLKRDQNHIVVLGGVTDDSNNFITMLRVDPITKRLLISASGSGLGTVTSVSVVTANGISGTVATETTTPAITLSLGAITPTGVQVSGLTASEIVLTDASKNLVSAGVATYPSLTELSYVKGLSSAVQTQLGNKAPTTAPTFATSITGSYLTASEILITDGSKNIVSAPVATYPSLTELSYVKGLTSAVQTQIGNLVPKSLYDANTILYATTDNTPVALTVATNNLIGRINGDIVNVPIDSDLSSVSAGDDTVPSAKATKAMGDLKLPLAGGTMTGNIVLGDAKQIVLTAPSADVTCTGFSTSAFNSGYTSSAVGDLVYLDASATWQKTDADSTTTAYGLIGIALAVASSGNPLLVALPGSFVRVNAWNWTVGNTLYLGETPGEMQNTIPTGADNVIRVVGFAVNADYIYFYPSQDVQTTVA